MTINEFIKELESKAELEKERAFYDAVKWNRITAYGEYCRKLETEYRQLAEWLKELQAHREAWNKLKNDVVAYHNNYDYDTAMHFLNIIDTRLSEIGGDAE